ncbi:hypothetical protein HOD29_03050 [archaeon]|jgi:asparagine N-glycosylation enzyme membrane subunit Stt3|nr:hypothetical protein [archaeon]
MVELKKDLKKVVDFLSQKKVQNIILLVLFLLILFSGTYIRLQNLDLLKDATTGEQIPLALDPFYFLRMAETMLEGPLPAFDELRAPGYEVGWHHEILSDSIVYIYKIGNVFDSSFTLRLADVLNPVIFFVLGMIVFFFLMYLLSKSKWAALLGSSLLAIIPPYLYRTMAGFADHESIGMFAFFLVLFVFIAGLNKIKKGYGKSVLFGGLLGIATAFSVVSWTGIAKFLFMIIPLTFLVIWLLNDNKKDALKKISFYLSWIVFAVIGVAIFGYSPSLLITGLMFSSTGILTFFTLGLIIVDTLVLNYGKKIFQNYMGKKRILISGAVTIVLGAIVYQIFIGNAFELFSKVFNTILNPFGSGRLTVTVAENKTSYLMDWITQIGKSIFWIFFFACIYVGKKISEGIGKKKNKSLFIVAWILFISGILFSRISVSSTLNGGTLSQIVFFIPTIFFLAVVGYIHAKDKVKISNELVLIVAWMIPMLIAVGGAIRLFFAIVPFVCFIIFYSLFSFFKDFRKSKDDLVKMLGYLIILLIIIGLVVSSVGFIGSDFMQAKNQAPSANTDWQNAMNWVRTNTNPGEVFVHWWDYGYWIETLGERPVMADGGQMQSRYNGNHKIGRYILTTPFPETAMSFFKTMDVSYLLIDPTDIGKYSAYSSIGSDESGNDRASWIVTLTSDPKETQETRDGVVRAYRGGTYLDEDIYYEEENGSEVFLPAGRAALAALTIQRKNDGSYTAPTAIYVYNGQQYNLPIRFLYAEGNLIDFGEGVESTVYIYANVYNSGQGSQFDFNGAAMYLSERTKDSLVAKLYLMNDPLNEYPGVELVHSEATYDFNFYYNGFRGPIKIWNVQNIPENIRIVEEFGEAFDGYATLDDLVFKD